ncbi:hypothetical protein OH76DRAFT_1491260, partial [Lentinus brumalis]
GSKKRKPAGGSGRRSGRKKPKTDPTSGSEEGVLLSFEGPCDLCRSKGGRCLPSGKVGLCQKCKKDAQGCRWTGSNVFGEMSWNRKTIALFNGEGWVPIPGTPDIRYMAVRFIAIFERDRPRFRVVDQDGLAERLRAVGLPNAIAPTAIPADFAPTVEPAEVAAFRDKHKGWAVFKVLPWNAPAPAAPPTTPAGTAGPSLPAGVSFSAPFSVPYRGDLSGLSPLDRLVAENRLEANRLVYDIWGKAHELVARMAREKELTGETFGKYQSEEEGVELPRRISFSRLAATDPGQDLVAKLLRFRAPEGEDS